MPTYPCILLIEDSPGECELFRAALAQTHQDVALYTEQDAEAALHFLKDRYHQSSIQARWSPLQGGGRSWSPAARGPRQESTTACRASTESHPGLPSVILLDWQLHNRHGGDFLKDLRADHRFTSIPVVVFTTSDDASDLSASYAHGANGYVVKPGTYEVLVQFTADFCRYWLQWNRTPATIESRC
jgi:CheY-like chemotaxis protein